MTKMNAFDAFKQLSPMLHTMLSLQHVEMHRTVASQGGIMDCQPEPVVMDTLQYLIDLAELALSPPQTSPRRRRRRPSV